MKKILLLTIFMLPMLNLTAQVQGLSSEKLRAVNPSTVHKRTVEFEPSLGYLWAKKTFDNEGKPVPLSTDSDSTLVLEGLGFRFTYGFAENFEAGGIVTTDLTTFSLGIKYNFFHRERFSAAAVMGTTFSNESDLVFRNTGFFGKTAGVAAGVVFSNKIGKRFSVDYDFQYQNIFNGNKSYTDDYFLTADVGYMVKESHLLITGLSYRYNHYKIADRSDAYLLSLDLGTAIMAGRMFILVFNFPIDLAGRNVDRFNGFTFALTITFD